MNSEIAEKCLLCGQVFPSCEKLQKHFISFHKPSRNFVVKESAFRRTVLTYRYTYPTKMTDFNLSQQKVMPDLINLLQGEAGKKTLIKVGLIIICEMSMLDPTGDKMTTTLIPFRANSFIVNGYNLIALRRNITQSFRIQESDMEEFCNCGSNWVFDRAVAFDTEIASMRPLTVGQESETNTDDSSSNSEQENVEIQSSTSTDDDDDDENEDNYPNNYSKHEFYDEREARKFNTKNIKNNKFLYNPSNYDEKCFLYCVLKHLKLTHRHKKYRGWSFKQFEKTLNTVGITFPISIPQIEMFCKQNPNLGLRINVILSNTKNHIFPLEYGIGRKDSKKTMNLLMVQKKKCNVNEINNHFLLILDIHKFLRKTYHQGSKQKSFTCINCLNGFSSIARLEAHEQICCLNKPRLEIVSKEPVMCFNNFQNQHPVEYIAFLDFECVLPRTATPCPDCTHLRCKCDKSFTEPVADQLPITYSLVILDQNGLIIHKKTHSSHNAADHLIDHLLQEEAGWIRNLFSEYVEMKLSQSDWVSHNAANTCYMCQKPFNFAVKCRDHCHFTGKYIGAACQQCNLRRKRPTKLNIFLHNGSKYDFHFIVKAINNKKGIENIRILPYNSENFRTVSFNCFTFVDSMSFLQNSLAKLSYDLAQTDNTYSILKQTDLVKTNNKFSSVKYQLVLGKSFFPYEYW